MPSGAEGDICRPPWLRYQFIQQRYGALVSAVFDTGQIPKADRAEAVRATVAEHLLRVEIDFPPDHRSRGGAYSDHRLDRSHGLDLDLECGEGAPHRGADPRRLHTEHLHGIADDGILCGGPARAGSDLAPW